MRSDARALTVSMWKKSRLKYLETLLMSLILVRDSIKHLQVNHFQAIQTNIEGFKTSKFLNSPPAPGFLGPFANKLSILNWNDFLSNGLKKNIV